MHPLNAYHSMSLCYSMQKKSLQRYIFYEVLIYSYNENPDIQDVESGRGSCKRILFSTRDYYHMCFKSILKTKTLY